MFKSIQPKHKYAFLFSSSNEYVFLLANVLMQLKQNSPIAYKNTDIIVFATNFTDESKKIISSLNDSVFIIDFPITKFPDPMLIDRVIKQYCWPYLIFLKIYAINLLKLKNYDSIVFIDTDVFIKQEIFCLFEQSSPITGRKASWSFTLSSLNLKDKSIFKDKDINRDVSFNGGVIVFNKSINKYNLDANKILTDDLLLLADPSDNYRLIHYGAPEELLIAYNLMYHNIPCKFLDLDFNIPVTESTKNAKIIHFFMSYREDSPKPWINKNILYSVPQWNLNNDFIYEHFHIGPGKLLDDSGKTYAELVYKDTYLQLLPKLDLYTKKLNFNYIPGRNQTFFIPNISSKISYGLYIKHFNNICVYIIVNDKIFINSIYIQEEFNKIINKLKIIFGDIIVKLQNNNFVKYEITAQDIEQSAFVFNTLVELTYDDIKNIFNKKINNNY